MVKKTPETMERFITALSDYGVVTDACEAAGITRMTAYTWRQEDEAFRAAWDAATTLGDHGLLDIARRRAAATSDTMLIFLLKGRFPETFRERRENLNTHQGPGGQPLPSAAVVNIGCSGPIPPPDVEEI